MRSKIFTLLVVVGCLVLSGCSDDDNGFDFDRNLLYGTWRVTHIEAEDGFFDITTPDAEPVFGVTTATFNRNGTYSAVGFFGTGTGTFRTSGSTIITYVAGAEFVRYEVISLTGSNAELRMYQSGSPDDSMRIRVVKQ